MFLRGSSREFIRLKERSSTKNVYSSIFSKETDSSLSIHIFRVNSSSSSL